MTKRNLQTILMGIFLSAALLSCSNLDDNTTTDKDYKVAETQLQSDYKAYSVGNVIWSTVRGYQIANFTVSTKAQSQNITAWYAVTGESAEREMESEDLGTTIPEKIKSAFDATVYGNSELWIVTEIEVESKYENGATVRQYEVEVENIANKNLEAELFFSYETGELLFSKEDLNEEDNDDDNESPFIVNDQLKAAVEKAAPGATIVNAETDNKLIEVDAIITSEEMTKEVEMEFSMDYQLISMEIESEFLFSQLPTIYDSIKNWFTANSSIAPMPSANTQVEITEGEEIEDDNNIGKYHYSVEIEEYQNDGKEYEINFYMDKNLNIIATIVNNKKY